MSASKRGEPIDAPGSKRALCAPVRDEPKPPSHLDDMVIADPDATLLEVSTGRRWIKTRRPELYEPLAVPTGLEQDTRTVRFDKKGV